MRLKLMVEGKTLRTKRIIKWKLERKENQRYYSRRSNTYLLGIHNKEDRGVEIFREIVPKNYAEFSFEKHIRVLTDRGLEHSLQFTRHSVCAFLQTVVKHLPAFRVGKLGKHGVDSGVGGLNSLPKEFCEIRRHQSVRKVTLALSYSVFFSVICMRMLTVFWIKLISN